MLQCTQTVFVVYSGVGMTLKEIKTPKKQLIFIGGQIVETDRVGSRSYSLASPVMCRELSISDVTMNSGGRIVENRQN